MPQRAEQLYQAVEITAGRWKWCRMSGGRAYPIGWCDKFCLGHETADGAKDHFIEYLTSEATHYFSSVPALGWQHCAACTTKPWVRKFARAFLPRRFWTSLGLTDKYALVLSGRVAYALCPEHQTAREVKGLLWKIRNFQEAIR